MKKKILLVLTLSAIGLVGCKGNVSVSTNTANTAKPAASTAPAANKAANKSTAPAAKVEAPKTALKDEKKPTEGNGKKAQKALHQLLEEEEAFSIFGMIVRQFRLLLLAREVIDSGGQNLAEALSVHPFVADKLSKQARGFTLEILEGVYRRLLRIDEDVKTGIMPIDTALEMFVADLTKKS